jgi:hypothetical protein
MNRFLNDIISISGSTQSERAAMLLHGAKVDKVTLTRLANRLSNTSMFTNAVFALVENGSLASGVSMSNLISEVYSRLEDMFAASNAISLLLDNNATILSEEIKKLEEELNSLEKSVNNYGFLLADGNAYDSAFMETFSDNLNFEEIDFSLNKITDRSGLDFTSNELALVDRNEGTLVIPNSTNTEYPLKASIWASNCASFLTNPSGTNLISNTADYLNLNGWRAIVDSPVIIDSSVYSFNNLYSGTADYTGAQFVIQYEMNEESPTDTIVLEPFDDYGFDLIQVVGFINDLDEVGEELMSQPVRVEKTFNVIFPKKSFKKFHIFINQTTYTRHASNKNFSEAAAEYRKKVLDDLQDRLVDPSVEITSEYPIVDLTGYWKAVLGNLQGSIMGSDAEILNQGLPSYWSPHGGLIQGQSGVFEGNDGTYYGRESYVSGVDVNHSYIQGLMNRFFGQGNGSIGSFFRPIISKFFYPNLAQASNPVDSNEGEQRVSPFPRIGEEDATEVAITEESDNYTIGVPSASTWAPSAKWDFWFDGVVKQILDREDSQLISQDLVWSGTEGKWVEREQGVPPSTKIPPGVSLGVDPLPQIVDIERDYDYRIDPPFAPSPGGGTKYTIPSIAYDDIFLLDESSYKYRYILGIKYVKAKLCNYAQRAVYISKPIGVSGDISEVKLKQSSINYYFGSESNSLTSVEYSVSNRPDIFNESSWTPIIPIDTPVIQGERLFPDSNGIAIFRFNSIGQSISLYKNGISYNQSDISSFYLRRENTNTIYGLKIPFSKYTSTDVLTCDYAVEAKGSIISFDNFTDKVKTYLAYSDNDMPGQSFYGTGQVEYALEHIPYIDYSQVSTSSYLQGSGLTPYAPISILLEDGSYVANLTNYKDKTAVSLDKSSSTYSFLQSKNIIIFNKPVNQNFRVFYNYIPSIFRVRVVLRSNYLETVSPKVDFYQVKTKTRKPDSQRY